MDWAAIFKELLTPAGIAALVAAAGAVISVMAQARTYRSMNDWRFKNLDERDKAVAFWVAWLKAQEGACDEEELKAAKLTAREGLRDLAATPIVPHAPLRMPFDVKRLLLLHTPRHKGRRVWLVRTPFLILTALLVLLVVLVVGVQVFGVRALPSSDEINAFATLVAAFAILIVVTRVIALAVDGDLRRPPPETPPPPPQPPSGT